MISAARSVLGSVRAFVSFERTLRKVTPPGRRNIRRAERLAKDLLVELVTDGASVGGLRELVDKRRRGRRLGTKDERIEIVLVTGPLDRETIRVAR